MKIGSMGIGITSHARYIFSGLFTIAACIVLVGISSGCSHWSGTSGSSKEKAGKGTPFWSATGDQMDKDRSSGKAGSADTGFAGSKWDWGDRSEILMEASKAGAKGTEVQFHDEQVLRGGLVIEEYGLQNGLTIILLQDMGSPIFSYQTWYRVGSGDETPGNTGMAHLFEHMLFRGTHQVPEGAFDRILELNGAVVNAATWLDWTQYIITMPAGPAVMPPQPPPLFSDTATISRLELAIRLEADRMANLSFTPEALEAEKDVVKNERKYRVEDDPEGLVFEYLYSNALREHPYRWPTIGYMKDISKVTMAECHDFYRRFYTPSNAAVVVTGRFDRGQVLKLINQHYGNLGSVAGVGLVSGNHSGNSYGYGSNNAASTSTGPAGGQQQQAQTPLRPIITEPPQDKERSVYITLPIASERVLVGYRIPSLDHEDYPVLEVISELLTGGDASRLQRSMVIDDELALDVATEVNAFRQLGMFEILSTVREDQDPEQIATRLYQEIEKLAAEPVSQGELNRALNRLEAAYWRELVDMEERAEQLGHFHATTGNHWMVFNLVDQYRKVTSQDIQRVSAAYLVPSQRTTVIARAREE